MMESKSSGQSRASKKRQKKSTNKGNGEQIKGGNEKVQQDRKKHKSSNERTHSKATTIMALNDITDCVLRASAIFDHFIQPTPSDNFFTEVWQKTFLHCGRNEANHFAGIFSRKSVEHIVTNHTNVYGVDIDVSKFENSEITDGNILVEQKADDSDEDAVSSTGAEAKSKDIFTKFKEGFSLRLLCPQKHDDKVWCLLADLEMEFENALDCHAYLSPPNSFGFGPRRTDSDSFVIQLEGSTIWTITGQQYSSMNVDVTLHPGDSLYMPNGWNYHEGSCGGSHSLYLMISTSEGNSIGDLLNLMVPEALREAVETNAAVGKSLPRGRFSFLGVAASENDDDTRRSTFRHQVRGLLTDLVTRATDMVDAAADQLAKEFIMARLPVPLSAKEESMSSGGAGAGVFPHTQLRMVRPGVARAVVEEGMVVLYHCMDNARVRFGAPMEPLEFELDDGPAIEALLLAFPEPIAVADLPHPSEEMDDKVAVATALFKEGFLLIHGAGLEDDEEEDPDDPF